MYHRKLQNNRLLLLIMIVGRANFLLTCLKVFETKRWMREVFPTIESPTTTTLHCTSLANFLFVIFFSSISILNLEFVFSIFFSGKFKSSCNHCGFLHNSFLFLWQNVKRGSNNFFFFGRGLTSSGLLTGNRMWPGLLVVAFFCSNWHEMYYKIRHRKPKHSNPQT